MRLKPLTKRILLYCVIGVLIAVLFIFLLPRLWKQPPVQEGAVSAEDVLHIIDADLYGNEVNLGFRSKNQCKS